MAEPNPVPQQTVDEQVLMKRASRLAKVSVVIVAVSLLFDLASGMGGGVLFSGIMLAVTCRLGLRGMRKRDASSIMWHARAQLCYGCCALLLVPVILAAASAMHCACSEECRDQFLPDPMDFPPANQTDANAPALVPQETNSTASPPSRMLGAVPHPEVVLGVLNHMAERFEAHQKRHEQQKQQRKSSHWHAGAKHHHHHHHSHPHPQRSHVDQQGQNQPPELAMPPTRFRAHVHKQTRNAPEPPTGPEPATAPEPAMAPETATRRSLQSFSPGDAPVGAEPPQPPPHPMPAYRQFGEHEDEEKEDGPRWKVRWHKPGRDSRRRHHHDDDDDDFDMDMEDMDMPQTREEAIAMRERVESKLDEVCGAHGTKAVGAIGTFGVLIMLVVGVLHCKSGHLSMRLARHIQGNPGAAAAPAEMGRRTFAQVGTPGAGLQRAHLHDGAAVTTAPVVFPPPTGPATTTVVAASSAQAQQVAPPHRGFAARLHALMARGRGYATVNATDDDDDNVAPRAAVVGSTTGLTVMPESGDPSVVVAPPPPAAAAGSPSVMSYEEYLRFVAAQQQAGSGGKIQ